MLDLTGLLVAAGRLECVARTGAVDEDALLSDRGAFKEFDTALSVSLNVTDLDWPAVREAARAAVVAEWEAINLGTNDTCVDFFTGVFEGPDGAALRAQVEAEASALPFHSLGAKLIDSDMNGEFEPFGRVATFVGGTLCSPGGLCPPPGFLNGYLVDLSFGTAVGSGIVVRADGGPSSDLATTYFVTGGMVATGGTCGFGDYDLQDVHSTDETIADDAGGITNRPLSDEIGNQESLPERGTSRDRTRNPDSTRPEGDYMENER